jgi:hypothetical protein
MFLEFILLSNRKPIHVRADRIAYVTEGIDGGSTLNLVSGETVDVCGTPAVIALNTELALVKVLSLLRSACTPADA